MCLLGEVDRLGRRIGARAGDDRCLLADRADGDAEELESLVFGQRRRLTRSAGDDDPVGAVLEEVVRERCAKRWKSTAPSSWNGVTIAVSTSLEHRTHCRVVECLQHSVVMLKEFKDFMRGNLVELAVALFWPGVCCCRSSFVDDLIALTTAA